MKKTLLLLSVLLTVGTLGKWLYDSNDYGKLLVYSSQGRQVTTIEKDALLGTDISKTEIQTGSWLGLLDISFPFGALPLCGLWTVLGIVGLKIRSRETTTTKNN